MSRAMTTQMSRRRLLQAAGVTAAVAAIPISAGAAFSDVTTNPSPTSPTGPVEGFRIDVADAVVTSLVVDTTTGLATCTFTVTTDEVAITPGKPARLVRRAVD